MVGSMTDIETFPKFKRLLSAEAAYVAIALSRNTTMGDDSVMECVRQGGSARAFTSWNLGRSNTREAVVSKKFLCCSSKRK